MNTSLPLVYLSFLIFLLALVAGLVVRQVFKTRKVESTLSKLQKKLSQEKGTAQEYYQLGSIYLDKKLFTQAIVQFQKALKCKEEIEDENKALIYNGLGYAYVAQEQYDLAVRQYKEALKLYPEYVTAWNNLAFAYDRKKLTAQALEAYEEALKLDPDNQTAKKRAESLRKRLPTTA
ncbi:tetratricopeptide repeat protein [Phormidium sp. CCY1219]|jgi:tetratricopeptide (TPR) repeat protein|uniref:tetratricopeptide repeat protein n=1 Tax=Phormidium sp. CCY1219 TaxID=2886104 RepID=UPI002D1E520E|nr:tetratricopeptide repeat protein [Phormidium sp. CCY1219]MEB3829475.1 tetratricopeptide repeat protein [Phormidium sp. CCY1219]